MKCDNENKTRIINLKNKNGINKKIIITNDGDVINYKTNKSIKPYLNKKTGYLSVSVNSKNYSIHRLVGLAFIENPNKYKEINHKDFNKQNNNVANLEWCTRQQNMKHYFDSLTLEQKEKTKEKTKKYFKSLTNEQKEIRKKQFQISIKTHNEKKNIEIRYLIEINKELLNKREIKELLNKKGFDDRRINRVIKEYKLVSRSKKYCLLDELFIRLFNNLEIIDFELSDTNITKLFNKKNKVSLKTIHTYIKDNEQIKNKIDEFNKNIK